MEFYFRVLKSYAATAPVHEAVKHAIGFLSYKEMLIYFVILFGSAEGKRSFGRPRRR
jgi:hypothetical protein